LKLAAQLLWYRTGLLDHWRGWVIRELVPILLEPGVEGGTDVVICLDRIWAIQMALLTAS
jgi:hypothetical protein